MSRFFINDSGNHDPRALLSAEKMATVSDMVIPTAKYIVASGTDALTISGDCVISIAGGGVFKTAVTVINAANLDIGGFAAGKDYYIYLCDTGGINDERYVISLNSTFPAGYNSTNSRKIGGFHYGVNRRVNARNQPVNASDEAFGTGWESTVYTGIVPRSVWTLKHRPQCSPEGMVFLTNNTWCDIYISSDDGLGGLQSRNNAVPMTGTEGMSWYTFNERAMNAGKRILSYDEFCAAAFGSPQGLADSNANAWSATTNTGRQVTGYVRNAVSSIGVRDAVGDVWKWTRSSITRAAHEIKADNGHGLPTGQGAWGWDTISPFEGYGNIYQYYDYSLAFLLAGGHWYGGAQDGSRAVGCIGYPWNVSPYIGALLGCDAL